MNITVAGIPYPYRFEKHAENTYIIKVSTLTVGKVQRTLEGCWTAHVREICAYNKTILKVEGFASRNAAANYVLQSYRKFYNYSGSQTPDQVESVLSLVGDVYE